jgi:cell pole-organizing protein PopZ
MGHEAPKEPTMEEILASIRKIISDDEPQKPAAVRPSPRQVIPEPEPEPADNDLEDLTFEMTAEEADLAMFEAEEEAVEAEAELEPAPLPEPPAPRPSLRREPLQAPAPSPIKEPEMPASQRYNQTTLTNENTADAAAGALGKLISRMELGGDNTIEGLVREMLKPMLKEWLDANLAQIVDEKVEAEVQRIARMAR